MHHLLWVLSLQPSSFQPDHLVLCYTQPLFYFSIVHISMKQDFQQVKMEGTVLDVIFWECMG